MKKTIQFKVMNDFLKKAGDELEGEWVLIGGSLLISLGAEYRATVDIDFISMGDQTNSQAIQLMEMAEKLGLPIEAVNQAGALFLQRISNYRDHLVLLKEGVRSKIYRPDAWLFLKLKCARMSESDLQDCIEYLRYLNKKNETIYMKELLTVVSDKKLILKLSEDAKGRLRLLRDFIAKNLEPGPSSIF